MFLVKIYLGSTISFILLLFPSSLSSTRAYKPSPQVTGDIAVAYLLEVNYARVYATVRDDIIKTKRFCSSISTVTMSKYFKRIPIKQRMCCVEEGVYRPKVKVTIEGRGHNYVKPFLL